MSDNPEPQDAILTVNDRAFRGTMEWKKPSQGHFLVAEAELLKEAIETNPEGEKVISTEKVEANRRELLWSSKQGELQAYFEGKQQRIPVLITGPYYVEVTRSQRLDITVDGEPERL